MQVRQSWSQEDSLAIYTTNFSSISMVTQLERPDGNCVWNEMGYLEILNQKEKTVHTFLFIW